MKKALLLFAFAALFVAAARYYANVKRLQEIEQRRFEADVKAVEMEVFRMASEQRSNGDEFTTK